MATHHLDPTVQRTIRRTRDLVEPLAASVYFAPECHSSFEALGFGPSPGVYRGLAGPEGRAYFASRGGCLGQVNGRVIAAAFGVFNPAVVVPLVEEAWAIANREQLLAARLDGQRAFFERVLTSSTDDVNRATTILRRMAAAGTTAGHPLYAGLVSLGWPGDPLGDLWRAADLVREHRGDSHISAWVAAGLNAPEILLLTEQWWGVPLRSYAVTRGWADDRFEAATDRLTVQGWIDADGLTAAGLALRQAIETTTDNQEVRLIEAAGHDIDELLGLLEPMVADIVAAKGFSDRAFSTAADLDRS